MRYKDDDGDLGNIYTFTIEIRDQRRYYYVKDHLGSIRVTINDEAEVVSEKVSIYVESNDRFKLVIPAREILFGLITLSPSDSLVFIRRNDN